MIRVELPVPPSLNSMNFYGSNKGRTPTPKYRQWKKDAAWELKLANVGKLAAARYTFHLLLNDKIRGDVSNRIKATEDLLVQQGITPDDRKCWDARASRDPNVKPGRCVVVIEAVA